MRSKAGVCLDTRLRRLFEHLKKLTDLPENRSAIHGCRLHLFVGFDRHGRTTRSNEGKALGQRELACAGGAHQVGGSRATNHSGSLGHHFVRERESICRLQLALSVVEVPYDSIDYFEAAIAR